MAHTVLGSQTIALSSSVTGGSVTVPSGTTAVYLLVSGYSVAGLQLTASTLNANAANASMNFHASGDAFGTWIREFRSPSIGSQTLALTFDDTVQEGVAHLVYVQGGVLTGWRDVEGSYADITLTTVAGDLVIALDTRYNTPAPGNQSGYTSIATANSGETYTRSRYIVAAGATQSAAIQNNNFSVIAAVSIAAAEEEEEDAPVLTDVDSDETFASNATGVTFTGTDLGADENARDVYLVQGAVEVLQTQGSGNSTGGTFDVVGFGLGGLLKYGTATSLKVETADGEGSLSVTINPPSGYAYVDLTSVHADPDERITASGDLSIGDQLEYETVGGLVEVFADATFAIDPSVEGFDVRAFDGAWGAVGEQTNTSGGFQAAWARNSNTVLQ